MKHLLLSLIITFSGVAFSMENPETAAPSAMISPESFIEYMNTATAWADPHSKVQFCTYTIWWAVKEGNNQVFDSALNYWNHWKRHCFMDFDFTRNELACPFVTAASKGYWYAAQKLLERSKGSIINDSCNVVTHKASFPNPIIQSCVAVEYSALAAAAKNGHYQVVSNLLEYQSDTPLNVDQAGKNRKTALMEAIECDKLACTQALLQGKLKKANPNLLTPDKSFGSVLHWALSLGNRNTHVKVLVEHGADVNFINAKNVPQEGTPLMVAVAYANLEGVRLLLAAKADAKLKHPFNSMTAKELAEMKIGIESIPERKRVRKEIFELLKQAENYASVMPGA